ncbi:hypothetical protein [Agromyces archimandritae]|uniref:Uncharacterized protein n=1 Tax=Agromyces archimandritae TaxID=2781962 RepID=A0A975IMC7_9MICO|nr:hypothetical protein [Agromyces archimandritae]QTX03338.1 hypothetical protein G127AT_08055 [Agromyces archimandritae]
MKRLWVSLAVVGGVGLLVTVVLTIIEGVKYRVREEQRLDPIPAPDWVAAASYGGLAVFALAVVALGVAGLVALLRKRRRAA